MDTIPSRPISPEKQSSLSGNYGCGNKSSDKGDTEITKEDVDNVLVAKPTVIVAPIPQATETIEAAPTQVGLYFTAFALPNFTLNQYWFYSYFF